jgi:F-type H+-transporting ATPase subunit delta
LTSVFLAKPYARALFEIGRKQKLLDPWLDSLRELSGIIDNPIVSAYLTDPGLNFEVKSELLSRVVPDAAPTILNLVLILVKRGALTRLPEIVTEYQNIIDSEHRIVKGDVTSVQELDKKEINEIAQSIGKVIKKQVVLHNLIDKNLLGGIMVRVGDTLFDGSARTSLSDLKQKLSSHS